MSTIDSIKNTGNTWTWAKEEKMKNDIAFTDSSCSGNNDRRKYLRHMVLLSSALILTQCLDSAVV